jgi:hypothetical protein
MQMRANLFDWQVASWLVDKLVVDLADFTMQEEHTGINHKIQTPDGIPHNSAVKCCSGWILLVVNMLTWLHKNS